MAEDVTSVRGGEEEARARALFAALVEAQPLPTVVYNADGDLAAWNRPAVRLLGAGPEDEPVIRATDGTNLWTIVAGRSVEARPYLDMRVPLMLDDGQAVDATLTVVVFRAPEGGLGGAAVFVLDIAGERLSGPGTSEEEHRRVPARRLPFRRIVEYLGPLSGADLVYLAETDPDTAVATTVHAVWSTDERAEVRALELAGTAAASVPGKRVACVARGLGRAHPQDTIGIREGYEGYVGVALTDADGRQVGVLGGYWREPLADTAGTCAVFRILGVQAADVLVDTVSRRELKESEQRYGALFEGSSVPMLLVEPGSTQIVDANPASCAFYGYDRDELLTMSILQVDVMPTDVTLAEITRAAEGTRNLFAGMHRLADGTVRDVEVNAGPIKVGGRRLLYAMVHDITDRRRMEAELESHKRDLERVVAQRTEDLLRTNAELQQASTARDMVFASLNQEARTSLQTITGFSDLLLGGMAGALNEEQARQLTMVSEAGSRLATFVDGLLESQRLVGADAACEPERFEIVSLLESVVFGLTPFAEEKGLTLTLDVRERPIGVFTDRHKLQMVLLNLLSNAVRYTEHGGVSMTVERVGEHACRIAVSDTGRGIAAGDLERLFEGADTHAPGAGIGLPSSRRLASVLGARLEARSRTGEGTTFTLELPLDCTRSAADVGDSA